MAGSAARGGWAALPKFLRQAKWAEGTAQWLGSSAVTAKNMQAKLDFQNASYHLELLEMMRHMVPEEEIHRCDADAAALCTSQS